MDLTLENVTKRYGEKTALNAFSYRFSSGVYGILGANSAGKSTMMNLITDNVKRDEGRILFDGTDVLELGDRFRRVLGCMPQQQGLYEGMTSETFLAYLAQLKKIPRRQILDEITKVLKLTNLEEARHKRIHALSGGMRQRLLLAQALLGDPQVLILDEPTAGLDPTERIRLRNYIAKLAENRIVLLATHIVSDIETIARAVLMLKEGNLVCSGTPEELVAGIPADFREPGHHFTLEDAYLYYLGEATDE